MLTPQRVHSAYRLAERVQSRFLPYMRELLARSCGDDLFTDRDERMVELVERSNVIYHEFNSIRQGAA